MRYSEKLGGLSAAVLLGALVILLSSTPAVAQVCDSLFQSDLDRSEWVQLSRPELDLSPNEIKVMLDQLSNPSHPEPDAQEFKHAKSEAHFQIAPEVAPQWNSHLIPVNTAAKIASLVLRLQRQREQETGRESKFAYFVIRATSNTTGKFVEKTHVHWEAKPGDISFVLSLRGKGVIYEIDGVEYQSPNRVLTVMSHHLPHRSPPSRRKRLIVVGEILFSDP